MNYSFDPCVFSVSLSLDYQNAGASYDLCVEIVIADIKNNKLILAKLLQQYYLISKTHNTINKTTVIITL